MTDQELQQLARGYAAKLAEDANLPNCLKNETLEMNQAYLLDFLRWLTKTHCIVSRTDAADWVKNASEFMPAGISSSNNGKLLSLIKN